MSIGDGREGLSQVEYETGMDKRVRPKDLEVSWSYIFRVLTPPLKRPPHAFESFGTVVDISEEDGRAWNYLVSLDCDRPPGVVQLPIDSDGFVVNVNEGEGRNMSMPDGIIIIGYLLGGTALSDVELDQAVAQSTDAAASVS